MDHVTLGRTGLKVSRLCLGTMNFGPYATEPESFAIMDRALELGIQFFDTANVYGAKGKGGMTEEIIGRWFAQGNRRQRTVIATKVYGGQGPGVNDQKLSAYHLRAACDNSLRRLQTDHIDLYQFHHVDRATPWDEIWQAMEVLVQQGKIIYAGSSNFAGWHIATANHSAAKRNFLGLVSEQSKYNLLTRQVELEVLPACRHYGVGLIPYSPLAGGLLGGMLGKLDTPGTNSRRMGEHQQKQLELKRPQIEQWEALCSQLGEEPANVALAWLLHQPGVTAPIIGPRTMKQLDDCQRAIAIKLDAEPLKKINEIFPGPGGEAPEAYAW